MFTAGMLLLSMDTTTEKEVNLSLYHYQSVHKKPSTNKKEKFILLASSRSNPNKLMF